MENYAFSIIHIQNHNKNNNKYIILKEYRVLNHLLLMKNSNLRSD